MTTDLRRESDVLVIGGGTMGLFTALNLAERGKSVTVVDRGRVWGEASGVNAGSLAVQNKLPPLVPYTVCALGIWKNLSARLGRDVGYHQTGGYKIAATPAEVDRLRATAEKQREFGLPLRWIDATPLRVEAPWLSDDVLAATYCPIDSFASPTLLGPALMHALRAANVSLVEDVEIASLHVGDVARVETSRGAFSGRDLAITAGAWSGTLAAMAGAKIPVSLDVNMISVTEPAPMVIGKIVTHARGILTLKQVTNGTCLIGGGWQGLGTLDDGCKELDLDQLTHNLALAARVIPGLERLHVLRSWAGYEGVSPDSLPYIGRLPQHRNVYILACARGGFTLGPLFGQLLSELIISGKTSMPIDSFAPGRFDA